jgi:glycosyltransferase involved in cell wall biosynthesis
MVIPVSKSLNCGDDMPLITVSMPAYNSERYIAEAIESVLSQTYKNFELVIFDDGSTDRTREIIDRYTDDRIVRLYSDKNQGLIAARNNIAQVARGKYLALLDADDRALPERFAIQVNYLETHDVDICGADHWTLNQDGGEIKPSKQRHTNADIRALLTICSPLCNPAIMGKVEIFKKFPYLKSYLHAEDYCLWTEISLAGYRFGNIKRKLIVYRLHSTQTSVNYLEVAKNAFYQSQSRYIKQLGIQFHPRAMPFTERLKMAIGFMREINQIIPNISIGANCELYARFQFRGNGVLTPFTRLERILVATAYSLFGKIAH